MVMTSIWIFSVNLHHTVSDIKLKIFSFRAFFIGIIMFNKSILLFIYGSLIYRDCEDKIMLPIQILSEFLLIASMLLIMKQANLLMI